jgi:hypothetical protein
MWNSRCNSRILRISVLQSRPATDQMLASLGVFMVLGTIALRIWGDFEARSIHMRRARFRYRYYGCETRRV